MELYTKSISNNRKHNKMDRSAKTRRVLTILFVCVIFLSGCKLQLAPLYNKDLITNITAANKDALELFASVEGGVTKDTFEKRKDKYDQVIASFEALAAQSNARLIPHSKAQKLLQKFDDAVDKKIVQALPKVALADSSIRIPSALVLTTIRRIIAQMKKQDHDAGLDDLLTNAFKNSTQISIQQALVYENALEQ